MYTKDDLKPLDVDKHIIENQELYFGSNGATAPAICSRIAEGALILGSQDINILNRADWWFITSDMDWLNASNESKINSQSAFHGISPFPEAGINSCRFEYFASVFSSALIVADANGVNLIKGKETELTEFRQLEKSISRYERILGFKFQRVIQK